MKAPKRMTDRLITLEAMIAELKGQIAIEEARSTEDVVCDLRERVEVLEAEKEMYLKLSTEGVQSFFSKHKSALWPIATIGTVVGVATKAAVPSSVVASAERDKLPNLSAVAPIFLVIS